MKKKTNQLTILIALGIAFLVSTTACIPAGDNPSANAGGIITPEITESPVTDNLSYGHSHDVIDEAHSDGKEEHSENLNSQTHDVSIEAADQVGEIIEDSDQMMAPLLRYLMKDYSSSIGVWSEDVMNLQSILEISQDGMYGLHTREAHLDALRERNLATDAVPPLSAFEKNLVTKIAATTVETIKTPETIETPCSGMTCFDGYEGNHQAAIETAASALPSALAKAISGVTIVNGCHPYGKVQLGHCAYGTWDSAGWGADGEHGHEWAMTIWVSNRGVNSGHLIDIMTHEAGHAYSYVVARKCNNPETGKSYREEARDLFGGEEPFADAVTAYFTGGSFQKYRGHGATLSDAESAFMAEMIENC